MIRPTDLFQARRRKNIPRRAITLLKLVNNDPMQKIAILESHDLIDRILPELGKGGLLNVIDSEWQSYENIVAFSEDHRRFFLMTMTLMKGETLSLFIPDEPWLDSRLRLVLDLETMES